MENQDARAGVFDLELLEARISFSTTLATISTIQALPIFQLPGGVVTNPLPVDGGSIAILQANGLNGSSSLNILEHRQEFSGVAATFTDEDVHDTSDYSATIDWGDGSAVDAGMIRANSAGGFDVVGSHTYTFGEYTPVVTVTAPAGEGSSEARTLTMWGNAHVFAPPVACLGLPVSASNGEAFRAAVARYVGVDVTLLGRYVATINWGDGQQSAGELVVNSDGSVSVIGEHVYADPGFDDVSVQLTASGAARDMAASTARSRATVANGRYGGKTLPITPESGAPFAGNVGYFQFLSEQRDLSNLRAEVVVSDVGSSRVIPAEIVVGNDGFYVAVNTVFLKEGYDLPMEIRVYDNSVAGDHSLGTDQQLVGLARGLFCVGGHLQLTTNPQVNLTAGVQQQVLLGHVQSDDPGMLWQKSFEVEINWGDQTPISTGAVVADGHGGYDIYGSHSYAIVGYATNYSVSLLVTETRTADGSTEPLTYSTGASQCQNAQVAAGTFTGIFLKPYSNGGMNSAVIGGEIYTGTDLPAQGADILATITWSDGVETTASVLQVGDGHYRVESGRELSSGAYQGTLKVTAGSYEKTYDFSVSVYGAWDPSQYVLNAAIQPARVAVYRGDHFHGVIATFTTDDPTAKAEDFSASGWISGAANLSTSVIQNDDGSFSIVADFDAASVSDNLYPGSVTIYRGQKSAQAGLLVSITIDPTRVALSPKTDLHFREREEFSTTVASFTAPSAGALPGDFTATIDWGDGTQTAGVITKNYDGTFDISGTKTYTNQSGLMPIRVVVVDGQGRTIATDTSVNLDPDPVVVTGGTPAVEGNEVSGVLANFIDEDGESTDPTTYRVYHAALIDWGDGQITEGVVSTNEDGSYSVASTHDYASEGDYEIRVRVRRNTFYARQQWLYVTNGMVGFDAMASVVAGDVPDSEFGVTLHVHVGGGGTPATAMAADETGGPVDLNKGGTVTQIEARRSGIRGTGSIGGKRSQWVVPWGKSGGKSQGSIFEPTGASQRGISGLFGVSEILGDEKEEVWG